MAILVLANPDILQDDGYYYYLHNNVSPAFSGLTLASFAAARNNVSARGEEAITIAAIEDEMTKMARAIISNSKRDTTRVEIDSLPTWYRKYGTASSEYSLVGHYFNQGDVSMAQQVLDSLPIRYGLNDTQMRYFAEFDSVFLIAKSIIDDSRGLHEATPGEIASVNAILSGGTHEIGVFVQKAFGDNVVFDPPGPYSFPTCLDHSWLWERKANNSNNQAIPPLTSVRSSDAFLSVSPNPAKDIVYFKYDVPEAKTEMLISVTSVAGQVLKQFTVTDTKGTLTWDTKGVPAGTYMYKLSGNRGVINTGKLVIVK